MDLLVLLLWCVFTGSRNLLHCLRYERFLSAPARLLSGKLNGLVEICFDLFRSREVKLLTRFVRNHIFVIRTAFSQATDHSRRLCLTWLTTLRLTSWRLSAWRLGTRRLA